MHSLRRILSLVTAILLLLGLTFPANAQAPSPSITVEDQDVENGNVTIQQVVAEEQGWIVIHAEEDGEPGPVIGYTQVAAGENSNVVVEIDQEQATETLYAMLHIDAGQIGEFEFPGPDAPVMENGEPVTEPFEVTNLDEIVAVTPDETPDDVDEPDETPAVTPDETPDDVDEPDETPAVTPDETPDDVDEPDETPAVTPDETPDPDVTPTPVPELPELGAEGPGPWSTVLLVLGGLIVLGAIALSVARREQ
jgi:hypothetical protein